MRKCPVSDGLRRLRRVTLPPVCVCNVVANLRQDRAVDILHGQPAIADQFTRSLQTDRPQAKAERTVALYVLGDPAVHPCCIERVGIVLRDVGIGEHGIKRVKIIRRQFPQEKALCFKLHIFSSIKRQ